MKNSTTYNFFDYPKEKSKIKVYIVTEFFKTYFSIINNSGFSNKIYYIDLFCGPGIYNDGTRSTPLVLLDIVESFEKDDIRNKLVMLFNDENTEYYNKLKNLVEQHPVYEKLKNPPKLYNKRASEVDLSTLYTNNKPKFSFIDPWGYIDVSAEQISKLIMSIGPDCILFFNSNRILQDLGKQQSKDHMKNIFGGKYEKALSIQQDKHLSQPIKAHSFVSLFSQNLYDSYFAKLKKIGYHLFVLPFAVEQDDVEKVSHYLLFITKNHKAILEMKKIMVKKSNTNSVLLGYDDKDSMLISLFNRNDDVVQGIKELFNLLFAKYPDMHTKVENVYGWLKILDSFSMSVKYEVSPYTADELKKCIHQWDEEGQIDVELPSTRYRHRITNERKFSFKRSIVV